MPPSEVEQRVIDRLQVARDAYAAVGETEPPLGPAAMLMLTLELVQIRDALERLAARVAELDLPGLP